MSKLRKNGFVCLNLLGESVCIGLISVVTTVSLVCIATLTWIAIL